ncbi:hypothetical protein [Catalinimonas niigatensis]|uniref:hypothetical protein n=1 Tax=Catalinimonas niigatensis TaxID=1397264 RepID=UPI0026657E85|nr:hypothetical protein [Catalinimonas niigatensis]WPP48432.1 hypothetical protein PZB72_17305 [Catalinimonas niigatensis]
MIDTTFKETNIAQVAIKKSETDYEVITLFQFLKKSAIERTELVVGKKVEFIDYKGGKVPLLEGLKAITLLIKKLREEGQLLSNMPV